MQGTGLFPEPNEREFSHNINNKNLLPHMKNELQKNIYKNNKYINFNYKSLD